MISSMKFRLILTLTIGFALLSLPTLVFAGDAELLFEAGNHAYLQGDYAEALEKWKQVESMGIGDGVLFYNLGNVYYKLDHLGEAILYWEKAARRRGEDADISANLAIAHARLADKTEEQVRLPVWDWFDSLRGRFSAAALGWISVILSFALFAALGVKRWLLKSIFWQARLKWLAAFLTIFIALDLGFLTLKARDETSRLQGVMLVPQSEVLSAPTEGSGKLLFTLHEGTKVNVLRRVGGWFEIAISKDKQGWVKEAAVGII
ncbi:MAG: tetratricopeptide repeat protein [Calditrichaeota bacterium]|nr:tetratricopeptide repeat protein [Calditrichota bacterium]